MIFLGVTDPLMRLLELTHDRSLSNLETSSLDSSSFQVPTDSESFNNSPSTPQRENLDCLKTDPVSFSTPYRSKPIQETSVADSTSDITAPEPESTTSETPDQDGQA